MAKYTKVSSKDPSGKTVVRYKDGKNYVDGKDVPEVVRTGLNEVKEGTILDELGDVFDPETDSDESEDEQAPTGSEEDDASEEDDSDLDEQETPAPKPPKPAAKKAVRNRSTASDDDADDGSGEEGMGFPRVNGKTVDIFDGKTPHTHVKNVGGHMVPLSKENYDTKTDVEILQRLKKLGKTV